jgi:hypothetical protein
MMKETNNNGDPKVRVNVDVLVYLKYREEPIRQLVTFELDPTHLDEDQELEDFMQIALRHVLATIDVVREHRLILSDERFNKGVFLTEQIQAISILAPDEETLLGLLKD